MALVNIDVENESTSINDNEIINQESKFSDENSVIEIPSFYFTSTNSIQTLGFENPCDSSCQCTTQVVEYCTEHGSCGGQNEAVECTEQTEGLAPIYYVFEYPAGIDLDSNGYIYIVDNGKHNIIKLDSNLAYVDKFGLDIIKNDNTGLNTPIDCGIDTNGDVYITDTGNERLVKLNPNLDYVSQFGTTGISNTDNTGLNNPQGMCIDSNNNIYIADCNNNRLVKLNSNLEFIGQFGITGSPLSDNTGLNNPSRCCTDTEGNVYIVDVDRVVKIDANMRYISQFDKYRIPVGKTQTLTPAACCMGTDGNIYIFDMSLHRVIKMDGYLNYLSEYLDTNSTSRYMDSVADSNFIWFTDGYNKATKTIRYSDFTSSVNPCDTACQDTCEMNCQTTCEAACQCEVQGCQTCQATCQASCQCSIEGCENCQTFCETACQCEVEGCQTCQTSCQTSCQCLDQSNQCSICESACQTACESACQCNIQGCQTCQDSCQLNCQTMCQTACQCENQSTQTNLPVIFTWIKTVDNGRTIITNKDLNSIMDAYATIFAYSGIPILEMIRVPDTANTIWEAKYYNSLVANVNRLYNYGYVSESLSLRNPGDIINISDMDKLVEIYNTAVANINKDK